MSRLLFNNRNRQRIVNDLTKMINSNPNVQIEQILMHPDLSQSLRNEIPELVDYLFIPNVQPENQQHLDQLIDWAIGTKYQEENIRNRIKGTQISSPLAEPLALSRNAALVLSSLCSQLQSSIDKDKRLYYALRNFTPRCKDDIQKLRAKALIKKQLLSQQLGIPIDEITIVLPYDDRSLVGNFQKIVDCYVRFTKGELLKYISDQQFIQFLCKKVVYSGYRDLLQHIILDTCNVSEKINKTSEINQILTYAIQCLSYSVRKFIQNQHYQHAYSSISLLSSVAIDDNINIFFQAYDDPQKTPLQDLFESAVIKVPPETPTIGPIYLKLFNLLQTIANNKSDDCQQYLTDYVEEIGFGATPFMTLKEQIAFPLFANTTLQNGSTPLELFLNYVFVDVSLRPIKKYVPSDEQYQPQELDESPTIHYKDWQQELFGNGPVEPAPPSTYPDQNHTCIEQMNTFFCKSWLDAFMKLAVTDQKKFCVKNQLLNKILNYHAYPPTVGNLCFYKTMGVATNGFVLKLFKYISQNQIVDFPENDPKMAEKWYIIQHHYIRGVMNKALEANNQLPEEDLENLNEA